MDVAKALGVVPETLRQELFDEYKLIVQNYAEHRWLPSELAAGRFCEIVYCVLNGYAKGTYPARASKPANFVVACKQLEGNSNVPRSFQILIPRTLPALYEVRNQRGVGHVGGDVDSNHMDATFVMAVANWILAELIRVFHQLSIVEAQQLVDAVSETRVPLIWHGQDIKRVLNPKIGTREQLLLLIASTPGKVSTKKLREWTEYKNATRFIQLLESLHAERMIEFNSTASVVEILPPGSFAASEISSRFRN